VLAQSLAIIEYLNETRPDPPLLPADPQNRATVRAMALAIACDGHPLNNRRVTQYLRRELGADEEAVTRWIRHWIGQGFTALEAWIVRHSVDGRHCYGTAVTMADVCLVPQVYNARRFALDLARGRGWLLSHRLEALPAFTRRGRAAAGGRVAAAKRGGPVASHAPRSARTVTVVLIRSETDQAELAATLAELEG
jgi:maleylpyruvate isomerase